MMLERVPASVQALCRLSAGLSFLCLAAAAAVTALDIVLRQAGGAVVGVVDLVQLMVMAGAYCAIPYAFATDGHVTVDLVSARLGSRGAAFCDLLGALLALAFMAAILGFGVAAALEQHAYGDRSHTMGIPILWYWTPLLAGAALSTAAPLLIALRAGRRMLSP